ncbi:MAG: transposase, partial [Chitinophagales bacterium]
GNDKQNIFFKERNYIYFLQKVRKYIETHCDILAYVLMPNHFHFLIHADERTEQLLTDLKMTRNVLSEGIRLLLSAYTKGINKQQERTGNLIQQNTKSKCVYDASNVNESGYASTCFYYIHQNPVRAGLVNKMEDWHYSSYRDYAGLRNGTLCNHNIAGNVIDITLETINQNIVLTEDSLKQIW